METAAVHSVPVIAQINRMGVIISIDDAAPPGWSRPVAWRQLAHDEVYLPNYHAPITRQGMNNDPR